RDHADHRAHADDDAKHRQRGPHDVPAERLHRQPRNHQQAHRAVTFEPSRISSVPRRTTASPSFSGPKTSPRSPTRAPRPTLTHWATPLLTRITNVRSVVVTTLVGGTSSDGCGRRTGHCTSGYMPAPSRRSAFATSSSTGIDRDFSSRSWATRLSTPW